MNDDEMKKEMEKKKRIVQAVIHVLINNGCTICEAKSILDVASYVIDRGEQPLTLDVLNTFY